VVWYSHSKRMGLEATMGQSMREAGVLGRLAAANSSRESGLKEAVRFTDWRRSQVAMFQQKTPEVSALVTVFLVKREKGENFWKERFGGEIFKGQLIVLEGRTYLRSPWWSWFAENMT
jgi:hypothetical protein